ncbi:hypothetical protein B0T09DRAFT_37693 [Sordaria sp. MPI-SDFR-AT-0083]|nr:hypothetical protein B0T09DRAFT_37693 [Sordaria sp. MPI-SDFR-AT-0083]
MARKDRERCVVSSHSFIHYNFSLKLWLAFDHGIVVPRARKRRRSLSKGRMACLLGLRIIYVFVSAVHYHHIHLQTKRNSQQIKSKIAMATCRLQLKTELPTTSIYRGNKFIITYNIFTHRDFSGTAIYFKRRYIHTYLPFFNLQRSVSKSCRVMSCYTIVHSSPLHSSRQRRLSSWSLTTLFFSRH